MDFLNIRKTLPVKNQAVKRKRDYNSYYNTETKSVVKKLYSIDFEIFGY